MKTSDGRYIFENEKELKKERSIDLDALVPEPLTMKINGVVYKVNDVSVETYMRIIKMSTIEDEEQARVNFYSIFKESVPDLPDEIIENMNGAQVRGFLAFLVQSFLGGQIDPNVQKPMSGITNLLPQTKQQN